ncbi:hypothetical protein ACLMJK_001569 [Lecanora helva]
MVELGIAASIIQVADIGVRLSLKLYTFGEIVSVADESVNSISKEVSLTSSVLTQLGILLKEEQRLRVCSDHALQTADGIVKECLGVFHQMEQTLVKKVPHLRSIDGEKAKRATILLNRLKWPYLQPRLELMRTNLERLKSTLNLMFNVIDLARRQVGRAESQEIVARQKMLIADLASSNDDYVRKFEQMKLSIHAPQSAQPEDQSTSMSILPSTSTCPGSVGTDSFMKSDFDGQVSRVDDMPALVEGVGLDGVLPLLLGHYDRLLTILLHEVHSQQFIPMDSRARIERSITTTHKIEIEQAKVNYKYHTPPQCVDEQQMQSSKGVGLHGLPPQQHDSYAQAQFEQYRHQQRGSQQAQNCYRQSLPELPPLITPSTREHQQLPQNLGDREQVRSQPPPVEQRMAAQAQQGGLPLMGQQKLPLPSLYRPRQLRREIPQRKQLPIPRQQQSQKPGPSQSAMRIGAASTPVAQQRYSPQVLPSRNSTQPALMQQPYATHRSEHLQQSQQNQIHDQHDEMHQQVQAQSVMQQSHQGQEQQRQTRQNAAHLSGRAEIAQPVICAKKRLASQISSDIDEHMQSSNRKPEESSDISNPNAPNDKSLDRVESGILHGDKNRFKRAKSKAWSSRPATASSWATSQSSHSSTSSIPNRDYVLDLAELDDTPGSQKQEQAQRQGGVRQCSLCPKQFASAHIFQTHINWHIGMFPFVCNVCGEAFRHQQECQMHERMHDERQNSALDNRSFGNDQSNLESGPEGDVLIPNNCQNLSGPLAKKSRGFAIHEFNSEDASSTSDPGFPAEIPYSNSERVKNPQAMKAGGKNVVDELLALWTIPPANANAEVTQVA